MGVRYVRRGGVALCAAAIGCATVGPGQGESPAAAFSARDVQGHGRAPVRANDGTVVILRSQILAAHSRSVWDFLRWNVPRYVFIENRAGRAVAIRGRRGRSSLTLPASDEPVVIVDGARLVAFDVLQGMATDAVASIELLDSGAGTALAGTNATAGVIYIHTVAASD